MRSPSPSLRSGLTLLTLILLAQSCERNVGLGERASGAGNGGSGGMAGGATELSAGREPGSGGMTHGEPGEAGDSGVGGISINAPGGAGGESGLDTSCPNVVLATNENNYRITTNLQLGLTTVKPGAELRFDWSDLSKDLVGRDLDLAEISFVQVALFELSPSELDRMVDEDESIATDHVVMILELAVDQDVTEATLSDFRSIAGTPDPADFLGYFDAAKYPPEDHVYVLAAVEGNKIGFGFRMIQGFQLDSSSSTTTVNLDSSSSHFDVDVDAESLTSASTVAATRYVTIDWSSLTDAASGRPLDPRAVTNVHVARLPLSPSEIPPQFVNLEALADRLYELEVPSGSAASLANATDAKGNPFPGIDDQGTWVVALTCNWCTTPVPKYLTILKPCANQPH